MIVVLTLVVRDWVVKDVSCYLRNERLTPTPSISGGGAVVFISMVYMTETFPVSVIAPNTTMILYGILCGGIHPLNTRSGL